MKLILTQIAQLLAALLGLYGVLLVLSWVLVPYDGVGDRLNTARAPGSLYLTEPKYVFMARARLNNPLDKAILLGASNMGAGFKQGEVQSRVPNLEVHNLAVGGSNIGQLAQVVDLVRELQTPEARRHNVYVMGLWYGLFTDDKARWYTLDRHAGDTDIDIERYRYGFYKRGEAGAVPLLPPRYFDTGLLLVHPNLVLDRVARDLTASLRSVVSGKPPALTDAQRNAVVIGDAQKQKYLAFWRDYTDGAATVNDTSIGVLEHTIESILAEGGRVVLVDMPIPHWHAQGSPLAADYHRRVGALLAGLRGRAGVTVLSMAEANDEDFSDEVHPKPRVTGHWADQLAAVLNDEAGRQQPAQSASMR